MYSLQSIDHFSGVSAKSPIALKEIRYGIGNNILALFGKDWTGPVYKPTVMINGQPQEALFFSAEPTGVTLQPVTVTRLVESV